MKKLIGILLAVLMCVSALSAGAGAIDPSQLPIFALGDDGTIVTYSMIWELDDAIDAFCGALPAISEKAASLKNRIIEVQTLNEALMMLTSGRADSFAMFYDSMRYFAAQNEGMAAIEGVPSAQMHLIAAQGQEALIESINAAIAGMKADGTLDALWQTHVEDVIAGAEPTAIAMPAIQGAETIRVGISGDCPPMDYTTPDGEPAGYNTAMLAELSKRANVNFELVQIDSGARYIALQSDKIDVFFWHQTFEAFLDLIGQSDSDITALAGVLNYTGDFLLSDPYCKMNLGWLVFSE